MKDHVKLKKLIDELKAARAAGTLTASQASRIRAEAEVAADHDPRFLATFFHNAPPEFLSGRLEVQTARLDFPPEKPNR